MVGTDLVFVAYWLATATHAFPPAWLFKDYENATLQSWNWSFLPLDLLVSVLGLTSVWLSRKRDARAPLFAVLSLALTSVSGLMAIAFWAIRGDFDLAWWAPNLFLLIYPLFFMGRFFELARPAAHSPS
ncbi:MAG: DUF5360 family protein [Archangium sp.]